ncbi:hypothetical protein VIGAN_02217700 [Vigna angularis var. angularis]|uniref:Uncharacterized protein n=1 Tax=Vigna angularis var. angularis TaxID=157739 RepID=A0A0S3RF89_PHAAN|nr:hypothetical protein VIGAN_02217700 [Vigna angularis var. angularis]
MYNEKHDSPKVNRFDKDISSIGSFSGGEGLPNVFTMVVQVRGYQVAHTNTIREKNTQSHKSGVKESFYLCAIHKLREKHKFWDGRSILMRSLHRLMFGRELLNSLMKGLRRLVIRTKLQSALKATVLEVDDVSHQHAGHAAVRGSSDKETHCRRRASVRPARPLHCRQNAQRNKFV